jgi:diphthamide biosynthesis enzyme Dph1/Dph2-like protein
MAKTLFVEARKKFNPLDIDLSILDKLPGKTISLAATIQYIGLIPKIEKYLKLKDKKVIVKKGAKYPGHVLGCNSSAFDKEAETLLLVTDGKFHAINNAIQLQREIFVFTGKILEKVSQKEIDQYNKKTLAKKKKFLLSENVGLILSTKYGQHQKSIENIKEKVKKMNKKVYIFEANNIDYSEFENFPQIKIWVNTACYGLARDDPRIVNLQDIVEFLK